MPIRLVVGAQWGDEGKGAVVDRESERADAVVRFNGGGNAGHTLEADGRKYVTHLCPSGIIRPGKLNLIGPGVIIDPELLFEELKIAEECGSKVLIDRSAPVILPIHREIDGGREAASGSSAIGTTRRGIGPGYEDFWSRRCVKMGDLVNRQRLTRALEERGYYQERRVVAAHLGAAAPTIDETVEWGARFADRLKDRLADTREIVHDLLSHDKNVLFEGAQGVMLDPMVGSYPYSTSSLCTAAGVSATYGIHRFDRVIGIAKAYATRVGGGPFPTELEDATGELLRQRGREFGATTGRPRRCGWLDLVALSYACRMGGITHLYVTKLDILSGFRPVRACGHYVFEDREVRPRETLTSRVLRESVARLDVEIDGWDEDLSSCRKRDDLPPVANGYLEKIAEATGTPICGVGVGASREQSIWIS